MQISQERLNPHENSTFLIREYNQPSFKSPRHYHQEFELTFIEESYGKLFIGNSIIDFRKGDLFLFAPKLIHCFKNPKDYEETRNSARATCIFFLPDFLGSDFLHSSQTKILNVLLQKSEFGIQFKKTSVEIVNLIKSIKPAKNLGGLINLLSILNHLSLHKDITLLSDTMLNKYYYKRSNDDRIDIIRDHVIRNSHKKITASEITHLIKMSAAGFSRFFKARTEKTFSDFINEIRLAEAQKLLIETNKSIHDISKESGYFNLSNFNRQFKMHNNLTPKIFREYFSNSSSDFV